MSSVRRAKVRKRRPADTARIFKILTGPVYHDPLYRYVQEGDPVLHRRNPHKMPKNVAPLVCKISKDD